jgi:dipeptidyl-peptidase-4
MITGLSVVSINLILTLLQNKSFMKERFLLVFVLSCFVLNAQKMLTVSDAVLKQRNLLAPSKLQQLSWISGTSDYVYVDTKEKVTSLNKGNVKNSKIESVLTLDELNVQLKNNDLKEVKDFPIMNFTSASQFTFEKENKTIVFDLITKTIKDKKDLPQLPENAENTDKSIKGTIAYTVDENLFVNYNGSNQQVSKDGNINLVYGKSVHREEFGIFKGTFWSPKGTLLAFYRMDQSNVSTYPVMEIGDRPASARMIKYPMAGDSSHYVTVGVYNPEKQTIIYLKTGIPKEQYLTNVAWSPDEKTIYIAVLNRDQNHLKFNSYDASTGNFIATLFEEKDEKYVQPLHTVEFVPNKPDQFIWQSERDGFNHVYLYNTNGTLIKQLTKGDWLVTSINGFDIKGENLFFTSTIESPVTRHLCRVNLKTGKIDQITSGTGTHTALISSDGNFALDHFQSLDVPREQSVYSCKDKTKITVLKSADNPLKDYALGKLSIFTIKAKDGTPLYARRYLPVNFDSTKKYPALVYLYGGPNAQMINNTWNGGGDLWFQYMAQQGFVVFTVDSRGSENRGRKFEQATFRNLGDAETADQLDGVAYLKKQSWVDTTNMVIFGWSFGGFMTTNMMLKHPDIFKVGIAGGPVIDWRYYEIMYTERYMDTPQANPEGYKKSTLTDYAQNLKGRLLMIHGTEDPVVVWQHSLLFAKACVDKSKLLDYFVYPGHEHNVMGKDRAHLYEKITDYIFTHVKK